MVPAGGMMSMKGGLAALFFACPPAPQDGRLGAPDKTSFAAMRRGAAVTEDAGDAAASTILSLRSAQVGFFRPRGQAFDDLEVILEVALFDSQSILIPLLVVCQHINIRLGNDFVDFIRLFQLQVQEHG